MRTLVLVLLLASVALSGCFATGVNLTAKETPVPPGWLSENVEYRGQGTGRVATAIHVYPNGTSIETLTADLVALMENDRWTMGEQGELEDVNGRYVRGLRGETFFTCRIGTATAPSVRAAGVPLECRFSLSKTAIEVNGTI